MFGRPESQGFHMVEEPSSYQRSDSEVIPAGDGSENLDEIDQEFLQELDVEVDGEDDVDSDLLLEESRDGKVDLTQFLDEDDLIDSKLFAPDHPSSIGPEFLPPLENK